MLATCKYCGGTVNGEFNLRDHQRSAHPKEYYADRAKQCRKQAKDLIVMAEKFEKRSAEAETPSKK